MIGIQVMLISELKHLKEKLQIRMARRSFLFFCLYVMPGFLTPRHILEIIGALQQVIDGKLHFVMFSLPPRHGKSLLCSELFPAYFLGRFPEKQIIHASYASALSNSFSLKVRNMVLTNERYRKVFPEMALDPARRRIDDWRTIYGGGFKSIGVGGGITGHGCDLFIVDDPHKEGDEQSGTALQSVFDWWASAARTRIHPGGAAIFPMTRWATRDLAGRLLELMQLDRLADQWKLLCFPALALQDDKDGKARARGLFPDPLGRAPGEALWPERFSKRMLLALRAISERYFEALYQQNPSVTNAPLFELENIKRQFVYEHDLPGDVFLTADLATTTTTRSDYTVIGLWSYEAPGRLTLCKAWRFRAQWPDVKSTLKTLVHQYKVPLYLPPQFLELIALQALQSEMREYRYLIKEVVLSGDKYKNAGHLADFAKQNELIIAIDRVCDIVVLEMCGFPDEIENDDCVDMTSVASHAIGLQSRFAIEMQNIGRNNAN